MYRGCKSSIIPISICTYTKLRNKMKTWLRILEVFKNRPDLSKISIVLLNNLSCYFRNLLI